MGNNLSVNSIKSLILQDLNIHVAFPLFDVDLKYGTTACCVVDAEWLDTLKADANEGHSHPYRIILKSLALSRQNASQSVQDIPADQSPMQNTRPSPTVNIYVNVIMKAPPQDGKVPQIYTSNLARVPASMLPETDYTLGTHVKLQLEKSSSAAFDEMNRLYDQFVPVFADLPDEHDENYEEAALARQQAFIEYFTKVLYPNSKYFMIVPPSNLENHSRSDILVLEEVSRLGQREKTLHSSSKTPNDNDLESSKTLPLTPTEHRLSNSNLIDVFSVIESDRAYYILASYRGTTLHDLIQYNPGVLSSNMRKSFVVYQLLRSIAGLHGQGVVHGSLNDSNILIDENLWIQLAGFEFCTPKDIADSYIQKRFQNVTSFDVWRTTVNEQTGIPKQIQEESLVMKWIRGDISNFAYLMALNHLAGRREGDPNFHPILPWVTDFTGPTVAENWRDFEKTKFRLNKGDEQLDFTFDGPVPHHITDILSDITYYVYLARKTPVPVLCQFVRSKYEPNEYPSSIQRVFQWTPDECIPEFYTDPSLFRSIHSDMPDLQLPQWAATPEDFIRKHAEALESDYVSSQLHIWINLTFGCNLTGEGAIEAKNVALPLLAGQDSFMKHGIIQLFKDPHPQRGCNWNKARKTFQELKAQAAIEQESSQTLVDVNGFTPTRLTSTTFDKQMERPDSSSSLFRGSTNSFSIKPAKQASTPTSILTSSRQSLLDTTSGNSSYLRSEREPSIHSNTSSILDSVSAISVAKMPTSSNDTVNLLSALNTEPIRLPVELPDELFTEQLANFEHAYNFGVKYGAMNDMSISENPVLLAGPKGGLRDLFLNAQTGDLSQLATLFSIGRSWDMYCVGQIIQNIYAAGSAKIVDLDGELFGSNMSGLFESGNGDLAYDIAPCGKINISPSVNGVVSALLSEDWQQRPSAEQILFSSFPTMTICDWRTTLPLQEYVSDMYEYLAEFYQAQWIRRLYLADKWVDRICELEDEAFDLILPTFVQLFTHHETRVGSISLFPKLGHRLGQERTKQHLLKPIISMFETLRPHIPKSLFELKTVEQFVKRFGVPTFLQQVMPCYLEALTISDDVIKAAQNNGDNLHNPRRRSSAADSKSAVLLQATIISSPSPVAELAGAALVHICDLIGAILTSKHVMRQLFKVIFRDNFSMPVLQQTVVSIGGHFGETFTAIQYDYLIALVDSNCKIINKRTCNNICSLLSLLEQLLVRISSQTLLTELKSGFMSTLYKLLEPVAPGENSYAMSTHELRLRLTISMRTMDYLLHVSYNIPRQEWEKTIAPVLQKYFSGFSSNVIEGDGEGELPKSLEAQRNYQMVYAYSQFCIFVGQETMRRVIPTSDAIETMMYDHFSSNEETPLPTTPFSPNGRVKPTRTTNPTANVVSSGGFMSWLLPKTPSPSARKNAESWENSNPSLDRDYFVGSSASGRSFSIDENKLYSYSTQNLTNYAASGFGGVTKALSIFESANIEEKNDGGNSPSVSVKATDGAVSTSPTAMSTKLKMLEKEKVTPKSTPTSVLPWRTKWKPSPEDIKNWNRFLSTNSEEMSKYMQFSFNDLKLRSFAGHTSGIRTFGVHESSRLFASGSRDRTVKLWSLDIHQGIENWESEPFSECLMTYNGHRRTAVTDVHFLGGGGVSGISDVVASCDGQIHLWEPETGKAIHLYNMGRMSIVSMQPIFRSRCIVGGTTDANITFLDTNAHCLLHTWKSNNSLTGTIRVLAVNFAETLIAVGFSTGAISLLESRTGTLVASWKGGDSEIMLMKFYTNELLVTCAPADHLICIWNVNRLALVKTISAPQDVVSLDIYKDEIITISNNNSVTFTPLNEDFQQYSSKFKSSIIKSPVTSFAILPINQLLIFGCGEGELYLYA